MNARGSGVCCGVLWRSTALETLKQLALGSLVAVSGGLMLCWIELVLTVYVVVGGAQLFTGRLSDRFGWPIEIASEPGRGTTVIITFPASRAEPA